MNAINYFKTALIAALLICACINSVPAQTVNLPSPAREEKLLNGLKLLVWNEPKSEKVTVKLRVHSGAAFDPKAKMGTMALLADILFPNEEAKAYFAEELEGNLEIVSNYDYIQITASGKADEIQAILETLATAVTNPQITQENFAAVRRARLERIKELEKNPAYLADRAIAQRLFGDFPYGRSADGTSESLAKIDRADLLLADERFFTADNATLAVVGNVKSDFVYRATRQLFGAWKKSESKIPATFRLPDAPDSKEFLIEIPGAEKYSSRLARMVAARRDKDFYATQILTKIWQTRFCLNNDNYNYGKDEYKPHLLYGTYIVRRDGSYANQNTVTEKQIRELPIYSGPIERACLQMFRSDGTIAYPQISQNNFDDAKARLIADFRQKNQSISDLAELWLDVDTFKLVSVKDEINKLNGVTFADVQRVSENLQKQPVVRVSVKKSDVAKQ